MTTNIKDQLIKFSDWITREDCPYAILYGGELRFASFGKDYTIEEVVNEYHEQQLKSERLPDEIKLENTIEDLSGEIIKCKSVWQDKIRQIIEEIDKKAEGFIMVNTEDIIEILKKHMK